MGISTGMGLLISSLVGGGSASYRRSVGMPDNGIDELLEKVHRQGIHSLAWRERRFLKKMSRRR